ncbi:hypothetical protein [Sulfurisphaera ohwakuensis]|uniref:Uncharacterized protein n=1 Tax=Sulfurisphaera ohwakuensis TaxID=69656 RepID=A0A650CIR5_SULOH|nr:hypothetical protein [Sulfurisphaera ohwakuensis]MBB5253347.1 hypothetical protein [Sulfurisphaera ohwakuensis]QGR17669.1 hypothetical protein D1869_11150 [Sulfurisphaera ohwakuensis]
MINCKDLDCITKIANDILLKEGISNENFNVIIIDLPYNVISLVEDKTVKINSVRFESFSVQSSGEYEITSSYLLIAILYAFIKNIDKIKEIIRKYFGENSVVFKLIDIVL